MTEELERELAQHQDRIRILDQQIAAATEQDAKNQAIIAEAERLLNEKEGHGMEKVEELKGTVTQPCLIVVFPDKTSDQTNSSSCTGFMVGAVSSQKLTFWSWCSTSDIT
jgi:tRNA G18 (ribose-2'-O)-methylase SpoU